MFPPRWCSFSVLSGPQVADPFLLCNIVQVKVLVTQLHPPLCDPAGSTVARQAPLSTEFSRQEYWSGSPFPFPGDLPKPGIKLGIPALPILYYLSHQGSPCYISKLALFIYQRT